MKPIVIDLNFKTKGKYLETHLLKSGTIQITKELILGHKSISEIARLRGLKESTIEGHIVRLVELHELSAKRYISLFRYDEIDQLLNNFPNFTLAEFKKTYPEYEWFEIKLVMADRNRILKML